MVLSDAPTSPFVTTKQGEKYQSSSPKDPKTYSTEPAMVSRLVRDTSSSPAMHALSPPSASEPASFRSRSWPKEQSGKSLAQSGRLESKDIFDTEWIDFQGKSQSWSKDSGPSVEEDENLRSKDLLDTEWIDFQQRVQEAPQAPKRV